MSQQQITIVKAPRIQDQVAQITKFDSKQIAILVLTLSIGDPTLSSYANTMVGA
jgi:hypothetical protein